MDASFGFILKKTAEAIFLTPVLPFLFIAYGLLSARRKGRKGYYFAWLGFLILVFFSTPATVKWAAKGLEDFPSLKMNQLKNVQAIVILGGGERGTAREYGGPVPNCITLERLRYGARLARETGLPVLVSGGAPQGEKPEARLMAESLKEDFGITVRWVESRSLDTSDNALFSVGILKTAGIKKIALVTTALHMRRAIMSFRHNGLNVIPAPTAFISETPPRRMIYDNFPGAKSAENGWAVLHEWVGLLVQRIRYALSF